MASKRSEVGQLNNILFQYLERLGLSEEAKLEFLSKANSMTALDSYHSIWFESFTDQLTQTLHQIQHPRPQIDLNVPPPQDNIMVKLLLLLLWQYQLMNTGDLYITVMFYVDDHQMEDEGGKEPHGKRKRVGGRWIATSSSTALRIRESKEEGPN